MKPIFYFLLCFSLLGCSKDKESEEDSRAAEIAAAFKAVVGEWKFSRLASDPEFKNPYPPEYPQYLENAGYMSFGDRGGFTDVAPYMSKYSPASGEYTFEFREEFMADKEKYMEVLHLVTYDQTAMFHFVPGYGGKSVVLYSYSKDRLVFYFDNGHDPELGRRLHLYSEFVRNY